MEPSAAAATGSPADRDARSAPCHLRVSRPCANGSAAVRQAAGSTAPPRHRWLRQPRASEVLRDMAASVQATPRHPTPFGSGRTGGNGAASGRQVEASSAEHAGLALVAVEDEAHLACDVLGHGVEGQVPVSACSSNQLGGSVRRREVPLVRVLGDLCAVLEPAARIDVEVGAAYASARGDPVAGGAGPTPRSSERRSDWRARHSFWRLRGECARRRSAVHKWVQTMDRRGCP